MAKKRVHEIAKERGISSKEVLAVLQRAGLDVKAAASSVDEQDIARAFASGSDGSSTGADAAPEEPAAPAPPRPQGPPPPQQPPRRGRGRRRRTPWVEPDLTAPPEPVKEEPPAQIQSGATVKEVAESLGLGSPEVIKKLMQLGEMATLTQTLSEEAILTLAEQFEKKVDIVHAADEVEEEPEHDDPEGDLVERPPVGTVEGH